MFILLECDLARALEEPIMLRYFRKGLWPSIRVQLQYQNLEVESFKQLMKKIVETKSNASLWPYTTTQKIDQYCFRCFLLANTNITKVSTLNSFMKDSKIDKLKFWTQEITTFQCTNNTKISKKAWKKKKNNQQNWRKNQEDSIIISKVNAIEPKQLDKRKNKNRKCSDKDLSMITWQKRLLC